MLRRIREINKNVHRGEYSAAVSRMSGIYSTFYHKKIEFSKRYPNKSFIQIANMDCPKIKEWMSLFNIFDEGCSGMIEGIKNVAKDDNKLINIEGDDLFKRMNSYRNHCKMFARQKNFSNKESV